MSIVGWYGEPGRVMPTSTPLVSTHLAAPVILDIGHYNAVTVLWRPHPSSAAERSQYSEWFWMCVCVCAWAHWRYHIIEREHHRKCGQHLWNLICPVNVHIIILSSRPGEYKRTLPDIKITCYSSNSSISSAKWSVFSSPALLLRIHIIFQRVCGHM